MLLMAVTCYNTNTQDQARASVREPSDHIDHSSQNRKGAESVPSWSSDTWRGLVLVAAYTTTMICDKNKCEDNKEFKIHHRPLHRRDLRFAKLQIYC